MNIRVNSGVHRGTREYAGDIGDIQNLERTSPLEPVSGATLHPADAAKSLKQAAGGTSGLLEALTGFLGETLTSGNPAWSGDPVPRMRALQKALVEHGLTLPEGEREPALQAISVVENSVQLRLRLQQHRMFEYEIIQTPPRGSKKT